MLIPALFIIIFLIYNLTKKKITSMISPVGKTTYNTTSEGVSVLSLQWINVSSRSNTIVFLSFNFFF
jgi:hypothetical protein